MGSRLPYVVSECISYIFRSFSFLISLYIIYVLSSRIAAKHRCIGIPTRTTPPRAHFVARKSHSDTIAARGLHQRGGRSSVLFYSRRIHTWPHEAPEAARPLRSPRDRVLVRCCIPSARYALSAAAVWPPAGLPGAPLLENASLPATGQLSSAALHQPVRKATVY